MSRNLTYSDIMTIGESVLGDGWLDGAARITAADFLGGGGADGAFAAYLARGRAPARRAMAAEIDDMVETNGLGWCDDLKNAAAAALVYAIENRARLSLSECTAVWPAPEAGLIGERGA